MEAGSYSLSSILQDYVLRIQVEWLVRVLLLISMMLQLVLVVLGPRRYHSSSAIFRFVVWGAYISADAVAISALGSMMHSCARSRIYGIWAPVLLLHLGAPDAITAYSMADNELWLRHGFNMVYQVSVAVYVMYSSALEGYALASAILLLVAGAIKYGERTRALWFSTFSQIFRSCLPISEYMKNINVEANCRYVVIGEERLQRAIPSGQNVSSQEGREIKEPEGSLEASSQEGRGIVTIDDVKSVAIKKRDYNLCLSYALFKMYKRRFASLHFDEGDCPRTRAFWFEFSGKEAFSIVEMELKFMYDALFSKWKDVMFSSFGTVLRLFNCILMGAAGFLILREEQYRESQQTVTYVVISVVLLVEVFQLCRIMISDWTRVRLICFQVEQIKHPLSQSALKWCRICGWKVIEIAVLVLGKVQNVLGLGGDRCSSNRIHQHCLIETCLNKSRFVWKIAGFFPAVDRFIVSGYIKLRHIHKVSVQDELKDFIFNILKHKFPLEDDVETCRRNISMFEEDEFGIFKKSGQNMEEVILRLHTATTILDMKRVLLGQIENENVRLSRILSRYCAYLLLSRPNLLPLHAGKARIAYMQHVERLVEIRESLMSVFGKHSHSHSHSMEQISIEVKQALVEAIDLPLKFFEEAAEKEEERKEEERTWKSELGKLKRQIREIEEKERKAAEEERKKKKERGKEMWKLSEEERRKIIEKEEEEEEIKERRGKSLVQLKKEFREQEERRREEEEIEEKIEKREHEINKEEEERRWKLLAKNWGQLVIYMAAHNKTSSHAECVAGGGEFLSQVWVLVGHIGCGEQSDSAVKLKVEAPMEQQQRMEHTKGKVPETSISICP